MKIAFLQAPMFPMNLTLCGGMERAELEEITRIIQKGHKAILYVANVQGVPQEKPYWIKEIKHSFWKNRILKWLYLFKFLLKNMRTDVLHGHYTTGLPLLAPKRSITHFHGLAVSELPLYLYSWARKRYHRSTYIFNSNFIKTAFLQLYPDFPESRLFVLHCGIDTQKFSPRPDVSRNNSVFRFSFHGRWAPNKGIICLIKAVGLLEKKGHIFECHIAGSTSVGICPGGEQLAEEILRLSKGLSSLRFPGAINYNDLPEYINRMDVGIVPSTYDEPFGLTNLEYMACGLPVIASRAGGIPEIVIDGKTGILVDKDAPEQLAAAMETLLLNPEMRKSMGLNARRRCEDNFTWDRHTEGLFAIYSTITATI